MVRRRKSKIGPVEILVVGAIAAIAAVPKETWILIGIIVAIVLVVYFVFKWSRRSGEPDLDVSPVRPSRTKAQPLADHDADEPVSVRSVRGDAEFKMPSAPAGYGKARWISPGESTEVAGVSIPGGMIYVGTRLQSATGRNDPGLIDPSKPIASRGDYRDAQMGYWPSYSEISPSARRAYLKWLAEGRRAPEADIGFVFLFFYGLERRVIVDSAADRAVRVDWAAIAAEVRRLLSIYGESSNSFRRYAGELLDWMLIADHPARLYSRPIPDFTPSSELPMYLRLALGQCALDGVPVPGPLALAWVQCDPRVGLRTAATRCKSQFDALFQERYTATFGDGLVLPRNRTKLKYVYRAASAGLQGAGEIRITFGETPDVSILSAPLKKLQALVDEVTKALDSYSRYLGRNSDRPDALEGVVELPTSVWPRAARDAAKTLSKRIGTGMAMRSYGGLLDDFGGDATMPRAKLRRFAEGLESLHIGMEPNILGGARTPKPDDKVVLFHIPEGEQVGHTSAAYQAALLTLQLSSAVAYADGVFSPSEINHLRAEVESWVHLTPSTLRRLMAHLRLLIAQPVALTSLKKKFEPLKSDEKEAIATFMATVAQSDGEVSPDEVKLLEKIYKALGIDAKKVFSDIHAVAAGTKTQPTDEPAAEGGGLRLDRARIEALQRDTQKVSALLASIFQEDDLVAEPEPSTPEADEPVVAPDSLLGLSEPLSTFARTLLSRPSWERSELEDLAADLELMPDGALEHLNEAAFDAHDVSFSEGDDPIEINPELLEAIGI